QPPIQGAFCVLCTETDDANRSKPKRQEIFASHLVRGGRSFFQKELAITILISILVISMTRGQGGRPKGFGSMTGTITYFYNDFKGHVADEGTLVLLIPDKAKNLDIDTSDYLGAFNVSAPHIDLGSKVYWTTVNGLGNYTLTHVPAGDYQVFLVSGQTSDEGWFDATDDGETDPAFYKRIANGFGGRLKKSDALKLAEAVVWNQYTFKNITIYANETSNMDYDFGMTYN
ncbi:MAG: hypothetical protein IIZ39_01950, partial [Blautia sp.]|nr:hypothetical protein [Blautia sp.]